VVVLDCVQPLQAQEFSTLVAVVAVLMLAKNWHWAVLEVGVLVQKVAPLLRDNLILAVAVAVDSTLQQIPLVMAALES
jgi:hypothetical protein